MFPEEEAPKTSGVCDRVSHGECRDDVDPTKWKGGTPGKKRKSKHTIRGKGDTWPP